MPLLYFCYEPPRAAYTDISEVSRAWAGRLSGLVRGLFKLYRPLDRYLAKQADAVLVNGLYAQSLIRETYNLPSTVITHGVELLPLDNLAETMQQVRTRHGLLDRRVILTVNHLHPRKRIDLQLKAMPLLLKECPDAALLVVGSGPEAANLQQLANQLGLTPQQVVFAGFVPDAELAAYYAVADLYFHSGRAESFGLSVLEASAAGLPVVAADEGGPRDIFVEGETGFLVQANPENFAAKAAWLLNNINEAKKMGQAGSELVATKFTWGMGATSFVAAYEVASTKSG
jgi:glycosyltransferase involved in cell wall biosynthesis